MKNYVIQISGNFNITAENAAQALKLAKQHIKLIGVRIGSYKASNKDKQFLQYNSDVNEHTKLKFKIIKL